MQSSLGEERAQSETEMGMSGIYSPSATGFGGDTSAYGELGTLAGGEGGDVYGLSGGKEEEFADWLSGVS